MAKKPKGKKVGVEGFVRRTTRPHKAPDSYAEVEGGDEIEDLESGGLAGGNSLALRALPPQVRGTVNSSRYAFVGASSYPHALRNRFQENPISDPDYGSKTVQQKRRRLDSFEIHPPSGGISLEMSRELEMRKICTRLKIDFELFDAWPVDPVATASAKLCIPYLPNEIVYQIFENCRSEVLVNCQKSCARFKAILQNSPGIWLKARQKYYPGIADELPFGLDEESLFELATGKGCDYCPKPGRAKAYYIWSVRACGDCLKELTMCITDFRKLLKKKCKDDEEWTQTAREQVSAAIYWRGFPFAAKQCWKSRAYELIEEAERHMLDGTFKEWVPKQAVPQSVMYEARKLEEWGVSVVNRMEREKFDREDKLRRLKKANFQKWCMLLPTPIPAKALFLSDTYQAICKTGIYISKYEFISKLPKLLRECSAFMQPARKPINPRHKVHKRAASKMVKMRSQGTIKLLPPRLRPAAPRAPRMG